MMMADDGTEHELVMLAITPRKFRKWDVLAVGAQSIGLAAGVVADAFTDISCLILRHSEYEQMRHEFHEDAASELETLIADVEGMD
jgi:hypothetical protein